MGRHKNSFWQRGKGEQADMFKGEKICWTALTHFENGIRTVCLGLRSNGDRGPFSLLAYAHNFTRAAANSRGFGQTVTVMGAGRGPHLGGYYSAPIEAQRPPLPLLDYAFIATGHYAHTERVDTGRTSPHAWPLDRV